MGRTFFDSEQWEKIFLFFKQPGQNVVPIQSAVQWISGDISSRVMRPEVDVTIIATQCQN
jgi:hypothetical protein